MSNYILENFDDYMKKINCTDKELRKKCFLVFCSGLTLGYSSVYDSELREQVQEFFEKNEALFETVGAI